MEKELYKKVYFHAVRRAMLENETLLKGFMDDIAVNYPEEKLFRLDEILTAITDNDLFDLIMAGRIPSGYTPEQNLILKEILTHCRKNISNK